LQARAISASAAALHTKSVPNAERIFFIRHALRAGFTIDEIFNLTAAPSYQVVA
jgi:hypothetical protein